MALGAFIFTATQLLAAYIKLPFASSQQIQEVLVVSLMIFVGITFPLNFVAWIIGRMLRGKGKTSMPPPFPETQPE